MCRIFAGVFFQTVPEIRVSSHFLQRPEKPALFLVKIIFHKMKEYSGVFGCPGYRWEIDIFGIRMKNKIKIIRDIEPEPLLRGQAGSST